jgi:hypothetical protein
MMTSSNASASLIYYESQPFPKSTKTSSYVEQWGRLRFEGGLLERFYK